jgi:MoxR-like ATPase
MKLKIDYPNREEEKRIMNMMSIKQEISFNKVLGKEDIFKARELVDKIYIDEKIQDYIIDIVFATRTGMTQSKGKSTKIKELEGLIAFGASPRASIALALAAKTHAYLQGRAYVTPQDVKSIGYDVLRQRIIVSFEAEAEDRKPDDIISVIFDSIEVP